MFSRPKERPNSILPPPYCSTGELDSSKAYGLLLTKRLIRILTHFEVNLHRRTINVIEDVAHAGSTVIAAPGKFEMKRLGALEHRNDGMAVSSDGYAASNFAGSA